MKKVSKKNKIYFGQDQKKLHSRQASDNASKKSTRDFGEDTFSKAVLYQLFKESNHPLRLDDILRRLNVTRRSKKEILSILENLVTERKLVRQRGGSYSISESLKNIKGRVQIQRSGSAFVTPLKDNGENGVCDKSSGMDIYIPQNALFDVWNGDLVEVLILPSAKPNFRRANPKSVSQKREGRIVDILERAQKEFTVSIEQEAPKYYHKYIHAFSQEKVQDDTQKKACVGYIGRPTDSRFNFQVLMPCPSFAEFEKWAQVDTNSTEVKEHDTSTRKVDNFLSVGDLVMIQINEKVSARTPTPLWFAEISKKLGSEDMVSVQEEIAKFNNGIATFFPDDVIFEAKSIAASEGFYYTAQDEADFTENQKGEKKHKGINSREAKHDANISLDLEKDDIDLRDIALVTIDGADSKDFDDAIFVEKVKDNWRLLVAIADVSRYVTPFSKIDLEAKQRANSYYFPNSVEPMIPPLLSNGLCSLRPNEDHRVMFADMLFDQKGDCIKSSFGQGIMRSDARLSYEAVQEFFDTGEASSAPFSENLSTNLAPMLLHAKDLAEILMKKREKAGYLRLEIPEPKCVTKNNSVVGLTVSSHFFAHELIEVFMVATNEAVARFLSEKNAPCLYRIHPAPAKERLENLNSILQSTAVSSYLPNISPEKMGANKWLSHILNALSKGTKEKSLESEDTSQSSEEKSLAKNAYLAHRLILRSMMQARYTPFLEEHFGLASECYCHFTSPIRRYADLMVHRSLKNVLGLSKESEKNKKIFFEDELIACAEKCNERERIAQVAEREIFRRLACLLLSSEVGKEFDAVVSGLSHFGLFAEMTQNMAEGMIRMENLGADYFIFDEKSQCLYGQQSRTLYRLGDAIRVRLTSIDLARLEINLSLVESRHKKVLSQKKKKKYKIRMV